MVSAGFGGFRTAVSASCQNRDMSSASVLHRVLHSEAEAARLLCVPQATLHYWLEGKKWRGHNYLPVIRPEPTGQTVLKWAEFVEAGLLSQYRRDDKVPLDDVRRFIAICVKRPASLIHWHTSSPGPSASGWSF